MEFEEPIALSSQLMLKQRDEHRLCLDMNLSTPLIPIFCPNSDEHDTKSARSAAIPSQETQKPNRVAVEILMFRGSEEVVDNNRIPAVSVRECVRPRKRLLSAPPFSTLLTKTPPRIPAHTSP